MIDLVNGSPIGRGFVSNGNLRGVLDLRIMVVAKWFHRCNSPSRAAVARNFALMWVGCREHT